MALQHCQASAERLHSPGHEIADDATLGICARA
jgi:hypothetical protein